MGERISDKARQAGADRSLFVGVIVAGIALRVSSARIRVAQILCKERRDIYPLVSLFLWRIIHINIPGVWPN